MNQTPVALNPYLFFGGNCREAMSFYKSIFGGELMLTTFGEGPADAHADPKANSADASNKIMHARLTGDVVLLASDDPNRTDAINTSAFSLSLEGSDEQRFKHYFDRLSERGKVRAPLIKQFWGDMFGMVTDQFGVNWMINISAKP